METTRPILYGVADYAEIRKANAWFIDRTAKIRDLVTEWRLGGTGGPPVQMGDGGGHSTDGSVTFHRLVLVFHGSECVLNEEV